MVTAGVKRPRRRGGNWLKTGFALLVAWGWMLGQPMGVVVQAAASSGAAGSASASQPPTAPTAAGPANGVTVMVVGGSVAHGWKDPNDDSYLKRAIASYAAATGVNYVYDDKTIIGNTAASMAKNFPGRYRGWILQDHPQVVVISWGLADDLYDKTALTAFDAALANEINVAITNGAVVLVVTPPVTEDLVHSVRRVRVMVANELDVVRTTNSPNVYGINLFSQMFDYIPAHGQKYTDYYGDSWHPNAAGHALGGQILYQDLRTQFPSTGFPLQPAASTST